MYSERQLEGKLSLTNEGQLSLFPIGAGSAFTKTLFQNNILIIKGKSHLLVDCGTRAPEALFKLGVPITELRNFCITHSHADHIGGLEEVILMNRYITRQKPSILITREYQNQLWAQSLKGGAGQNERKGIRGLGFSDYWEVQRPERKEGFGRDTHHMNVNGISIHTFRTKHFPDNSKSWRDSAYSIGLVIDERILFTGDTRFDPELIEEFCARFPIELILHDVQFFPGGVHAPFEELKTLPAEIKKKTLLMHYPDTWQSHLEKVNNEGFAGFLKQHTYYDFS